MSVTFVGQSAKKRPVYADWERETRPEQAKDKFGLGPSKVSPDALTLEWPLFRPVYGHVRITTDKDMKATAKLMLRLHRRLFLLGDDAQATLRKIVADGSKIPLQETYLFVYECEAEPWSKLTDTLIERLHTGPAVPGLSVGKLRTVGVTPSTATGPDRGDPDFAVVTAIIDTNIGIGHERFRRSDGKTRVHHFWRQKRESYSGISDLTIGREFDVHAIDTILSEAGGDEKTFYALLRQGRYGTYSREKDEQVPSGPPTKDDIATALQERANAFYAGLPDEVRSNGQAERIEPVTEPPLLPTDATELESLLTNPERSDELEGALSDGPPYLMSERPPGMREGHGTWVADIAAGHPPDQAPNDRPIVAVELPDHVVADTAGQRLEVFVLMGLQRILRWCDNWNGIEGNRVPVVVNISLGNTAGPKDGTGFLESQIARLVKARNDKGIPTRVVMAAGNAYRERLTAVFDLAQNGTELVDWRVQADDRSPSYLEIRVPPDSSIAVTITTPDGSAQSLVAGTDYDILMQGDLVGRIYQPPAEGQFRTITVALAPTHTALRKGRQAPAGTWKIGFENKDQTAQVRLDVQRDDSLSGWPAYGRQSWLDHPKSRSRDPKTGVMDQPEATSPVVRTHTLSAHATGSTDHVLVVGGAMALDGTDPAYWRPTRYTASGPDFSGRMGPDLSAVSEDGPATPGLRAAGYLSGSSAVFSGTSGAAPQVTRALVEELAPQGKVPGTSPVNPKSPHHARLGHEVLDQSTAPGRVARRRHPV